MELTQFKLGLLTDEIGTCLPTVVMLFGTGRDCGEWVLKEIRVQPNVFSIPRVMTSVPMSLCTTGSTGYPRLMNGLMLMGYVHLCKDLKRGIFFFTFFFIS